MEAKDAVMQKVFEFTGKYISDREAAEIIEISFKAGMREGIRRTYEEMIAHHYIVSYDLDRVCGALGVIPERIE